MKMLRYSTSAVLISALWFVVFVHSSWASSTQEHKFAGAPDGQGPQGTLVWDGASNFYGATPHGGDARSFGTVFKCSRSQTGQWTESVIYSFTNGADGEFPGGQLVIDANSNLYGVASGGLVGYGIVFRLTPSSNGTWTETTLYTFQNGSDGSFPAWGLTSDSAGNLYGTTYGGGGGCLSGMCGGTVFRLTPNGNGQWTFTTLYAFLSGQDGWEPSWVVADPVGNLYGSTTKGGNLQICSIQGCGTVFELSPSTGGSWTKTTLYEFNDGLDGGYPSSGLVRDSAGNLYGETYVGGSLACPISGCGVVYELLPQANGTWTFSVAHTFNGLNGSLGQTPSGGLTLDGKGNLYGTTQVGGKSTFCFGGGCGTIFELSPKVGGGFAFRLLHSFDGSDGWTPEGAVIRDASGAFYGTTFAGGDLNCNPEIGCGVVFEAKP